MMASRKVTQRYLRAALRLALEGYAGAVARAGTAPHGVRQHTRNVAYSASLRYRVPGANESASVLSHLHLSDNEHRHHEQPCVHQGWHQSRHFRTHLASLMSKDTSSLCRTHGPEDTDRIVEELRYRNIKVPKQLDISWRRRAEGFVGGIVSAIRMTISFTLSLPGMIWKGMRMSPGEWRQTLQGWWATIKHEAEHYWVGFKVFGFELQVASRLVFRKLKGKELTRRERRQLTRTSADIFRVVPFSLFIIIPFAEVLLPVALRLFPNMLPSTFETRHKQEEDMKKLLKLKTELAGFLQQTVAELAKDVRSSTSGDVADEAKALTTFLGDVRDGKGVSNADIVKFARLFHDELTLDSLDRVHLVTLCQFLSLPTLGTEAILRTRLQAHLVEIKADDIEIKAEGIDNLTDDEMRAAARARGMPAPFGRGCTSFLRKQLKDWIELSLDRNIPPSLLLLSRAFKITTAGPKQKDPKQETVEGLKNTFNMLPEEAIEGVSMNTFKATASPKKKLEFLQREDKEIRDEALEDGSNELAEARAALEASHSRLGKVLTASARATAQAVVRKAAAQAAQDAISQKAAEIGDETYKRRSFADAQIKERRMGDLISSLVALASASGVASERELFMEVASREVENQMNKLRGGSYLEFGGSKAGVSGVRPASEVRVQDVTERMTDSVKSMLFRIEQEIDLADQKIGGKLRVLDSDSDGVISKKELLDAFTVLKGDYTDSEMRAVTKLLDGHETVSLKQLEDLGQKLTVDRKLPAKAE